MRTELSQIEQSYTKEDMLDPEFFLVEYTPDREKALSMHAFDLERVYAILKKIATDSGDEIKLNLYTKIEKKANIILSHYNTNGLLPSEAVFRYLRIHDQKEYQQAVGGFVSRRSVNINSILVSLGPDPKWVRNGYIDQSS